MNRIKCLVFGLMFFPLGVLAQEKDMVEIQRMMADIQRSHIEANVPEKTEFETYLSRDIKAYFNSLGEGVDLSLELLRDGPTQSGVAYPKYYLWVEVNAGDKVIKQGAMRVAAIEKKRFEVYEFLSKSLIQKNPATTAQTFPRMLLTRIYELAEVE